MRKKSSYPARSASQWEELVEQSYKTKSSLKEFCAEAHVPMQMLYNWRSKLRGPAKTGPLQSSGFTRLQVSSMEPNRQPVMIEVSLTNGRIVRVPAGMVDTDTLRVVLDAAEAKPC